MYGGFEELARVSGAMGAMVQASQLGVAKIVHFGSERQKRTWLPAIAAGDCLRSATVTSATCTAWWCAPARARRACPPASPSASW
jgi:alkylation response protein AidB-like acyl-CoA dehydrogenase